MLFPTASVELICARTKSPLNEEGMARLVVDARVHAEFMPVLECQRTYVEATPQGSLALKWSDAFESEEEM